MTSDESVHRWVQAPRSARDRIDAPSLRLFLVCAAVAGALGISFAALLREGMPETVRVASSGLGLLLGGVLVAVCSAVRAARSEGLRRRAWRMFLYAAVTAVASNLWSTIAGADPVSSPSLVAESALVVAIVLSVVGVLSFPALRRRGVELVLLVLDGLVVGGAGLVMVSVLVYVEVLGTAGTGRGVEAILFPLLDVILATVALLLVARSSGDRVPLTLIGAGYILYAVSDAAFAVLAARGTFEFGTTVDLGWILGYLLVALAACYPSRDTERELDDATASDAQGTVLIFAVLLLAAWVQLRFGSFSDLNGTQAVLWLLLVLLAGARQTILGLDNAALRRGLERRVREQTADLRRLARQTEVLLTSVGDGIYGVDAEGRITFINPTGARLLGYTPAELTHRHAHEVFHAPEEDGTPFPWEGCYIAQAILDGTVASSEEDVYVRRDGSRVPVEITSSPLVDGERIGGAVVAFRDITQRQEVDRIKNEFLSVVSHELRTPLTSIRGSLGLLAGGALGELSPPARRMAAIALESSERLTRLINDILDMERIESGTMPMDFAEHDVADLVAASLSEISGLAQAAEVDLEVGECPGRVIADADRIVQTLTNLVGNAIKYSHRGGVVRVETHRADGFVRFSVADDGRGIPAGKLDSIFDRFEQVDSSDTRQLGGSGLGLAISRGIVERHGGRIWAESEMGSGTVVSFMIPAAAPAPEEPPDADGNAPLILVCDDDRSVVETFSEILRRHGYRPVGVTDGTEAVARAVADRPAAVLVDLMMPDTSGAEVVAQLREEERTRNIPVVVVSGMGPAADPHVASQTAGWLIKPVSEERLANTVAIAVAGRRRDTSVLVIEDDAHLARVLTALLRSHGLDVSHAATAAEAVRRAKEISPQVIVLDLRLPDGQGSDVIAELRRDGRLAQTPVVVYSAAEVADEQRQDLRLGHTVFLTKGRVDPEGLEERVLEMVDAVTGREEGGGP